MYYDPANKGTEQGCPCSCWALTMGPFLLRRQPSEALGRSTGCFDGRVLQVDALYSVLCTLFSVLCSLYSVLCTPNSVPERRVAPISLGSVFSGRLILADSQRPAPPTATIPTPSPRSLHTSPPRPHTAPPPSIRPHQCALSPYSVEYGVSSSNTPKLL